MNAVDDATKETAIALRVIAVCVLLLMVIACTTAPVAERGSVRERLLEGAEYALVKQRLHIDGKTFANDCSGTILGIYHFAGVDLSRDFDKYTGNGVARIYQLLQDQGLVYRTVYPQIGDLVFWDNTYDRDGDGRWNDQLTHIGMVVDVGLDGTIDYIHHNYRKGIVVEHMNLITPARHQREVAGIITVVNSPMRMRDSRTRQT